MNSDLYSTIVFIIAVVSIIAYFYQLFVTLNLRRYIDKQRSRQRHTICLLNNAISKIEHYRELLDVQDRFLKELDSLASAELSLGACNLPVNDPIHEPGKPL